VIWPANATAHAVPLGNPLSVNVTANVGALYVTPIDTDAAVIVVDDPDGVVYPTTAPYE